MARNGSLVFEIFVIRFVVSPREEVLEIVITLLVGRDCTTLLLAVAVYILVTVLFGRTVNILKIVIAEFLVICHN